MIDNCFKPSPHNSQEQILLNLIEKIKELDSMPELSRLVSKEVEAAMQEQPGHPAVGAAHRHNEIDPELSEPETSWQSLSELCGPWRALRERNWLAETVIHWRKARQGPQSSQSRLDESRALNRGRPCRLEGTADLR